MVKAYSPTAITGSPLRGLPFFSPSFPLALEVRPRLTESLIRSIMNMDFDAQSE